MNRSLLALLTAAVAALLPWQARSSAAFTLNLGQVISAMNTTQNVLPALQSPILGISTVDVSNVAIPGAPCNIFQPGDPCRLPSYYLAVNRDAATILALRNALATTPVGGGSCGTVDGCPTLAQALAGQNVAANTIVGASVANAQLVVFYDSNPAECVISPTDTCVPPTPI